MPANPILPIEDAPAGRDEELFVTCKTCGFLVATGLRARAGDLAEADLPERAHRCPRCGSAHLYGKGDYRYGG